MKSKILGLAVLFLVGAIGFWLIKGGLTSTSTTQNAHQLQVATTFYPVFYFASEIGDENVWVINLTPVGADPHDFEPGPQDLAALNSSQVIILNGAGFEPWAQGFIQEWQGQGKTVVEVSSQVAAVPAPTADTHDEVHEGENHQSDPHTWLDPVLANTIVQEILAALSTADTEHQTEYQSQAATLQLQLETLNQEFTAGLQNCSQHQVVVSHAVLGYLGQRYGFEQVPIQGLDPEAEPSPQALAAITNLVKQQGIKYILAETLLSPRLTETLAQEAGVEILVFNPLEGLTPDQVSAGDNYFTVQRQNLQVLRQALECN